MASLRGRILFCLLGVALFCPMHAAGFSVLEGGVKEGEETVPDDNATTIAPLITEESTSEASTSEASTSEAPTTAPSTTEASTTAPSTTEAPTTAPSTTEAPTTAPSTTEAPTTGPSTTAPSTTEAPATEATTPVTTDAPSTKLPPLNDLELYEHTRDTLDEIEATLDKFLALAETENPSENPSGSRYHLHPAVWWQDKAEKIEDSSNIDKICKDDSSVICNQLRIELKATETLVTRLKDSVKDWRRTDLEELTKSNDELSKTYDEAKDDDGFKMTIDDKTLTDAINGVRKVVEDSKSEVGKMISTIQEDMNGSVVLVAVMGTLGGLMIVGLVGILIFAAVKKGKLKKKPSAPYNKLQGENIPIDGFLSDAPPADLRRAPRIDPYPSRNPPPPSSRSDPYASPYNRGPTVTRVGQALPRTHF